MFWGMEMVISVCVSGWCPEMMSRLYVCVNNDVLCLCMCEQ
jgi:hypothetical protein